MSDNHKKILILTADAGLGHRTAAEALEAACQQLYGEESEIVVKNPLDHPDLPDFISETQSNYDDIVKAIPKLYRIGYDLSDADVPVALMEGGYIVVLFNVIRKVIDDCKPDLIMSTYPIYQAPLKIIFQVDDLNIPLIAVVTDLVTVHQTWFNDGVTKLAVPTDVVRDLALEAGLAEDQVVKTGIPVDPKIAELKNREVAEIRRSLDWEEEPIGILVAGSPRVPNMMEIIQALDQSDHNIQFGLVAGGHDPLYDQFKQTKWRHPAQIYNFVDFMPELMRVADLIVSKAGGLIVTESLASGLPLMFVHVLPGQERGNADFVVDHDAGAMCETPETALETLSRWLENDQAQLNQVARNAEILGQPEAAHEIVKLGWQLIN